MRMNARRESDDGPARDHPARPSGLVLVACRQDAQRRREARLTGPGDGGVQIADKCLVRQMAVRINHRMREPGAISPSNATSTGFPPSGLAARIIPFDSIPISFAGFKLNTMPMVLPTSCSAS